MGNLYHKAEIKPHYLDREVCRIKCLDVFNDLSASVALAGSYELAEEEPFKLSTTFTLHYPAGGAEAVKTLARHRRLRAPSIPSFTTSRFWWKIGTSANHRFQQDAAS